MGFLRGKGAGLLKGPCFERPSFMHLAVAPRLLAREGPQSDVEDAILGCCSGT